MKAEIEPIKVEGTLEPQALRDLSRQERPVYLFGCDLEEFNLSGLMMPGWRFEECVLRSAKLVDANLEGAVFERCRAAFIDLTRANLLEARIFRSDFSLGRFEAAVVAQASFESVKMRGADFTDASTNGFQILDVVLESAKLWKMSFRRMKLDRIDLSNADLYRCDFREADFLESSLRDAMMNGCSFQGADLRGCDLGGLRLDDAKRFKGAIISSEQGAMLVAQLGLQVV